MDTHLYSAFAQDDWQVAPNVKVLYGVRYDLYKYPNARADSPFSFSQKFNIDKNNFGPRGGLAWTVNPQTVVRASTAIRYDQPILPPYANTGQCGGSPRLVTVSATPTTPGAPAFPGSLANTPPGFTLPTQSIATVDPSFQVARTWQNNVQVERALGTDYSMTVGYTFSKINQLPVVSDINLINPVGTLADGRPIYSTAINANTRMDPRFNHIYTVQSIGTGHYNALTLMLARRLSHGTTFNLSYSVAKGVDNAPLSQQFPGTSGLGVVSDQFRSDPTNLDRDKGPNLMDMRHNFNGSVVFNPSSHASSDVVNALLNNNQIAVLMQFNSGLPFNIVGSRELNGDGFSNNDRPIGVGRNSMYLPNRYNIDLRYSRFVPIRGDVKAELIGEFKNILNTEQTQSIISTVVVD